MFPLFRNGNLLFCNGHLATTCCRPPQLVVEVSGTGVYHIGDNPIPSDAGSGAYVAVELYDDNGTLVGFCGQKRWEIDLPARKVFTVRYLLMAWNGDSTKPGYEKCSPSNFRVGVAGVINGNAAHGDSATTNLGGGPTDPDAEHCWTVANSISFDLDCDPATETVSIT